MPGNYARFAKMEEELDKALAWAEERQGWSVTRENIVIATLNRALSEELGKLAPLHRRIKKLGAKVDAGVHAPELDALLDEASACFARIGDLTAAMSREIDVIEPREGAR